MRKFHEQECTNASGNQTHGNDIEELAAAEPQSQGGNQFDITAANALIDRVRLGFVVDMFNLQFMNYPVFNVADILVVCGAVAFGVYYMFIDDKVRVKKETPAGEEEHDDGNDPSAS